MSVFLIYLCSTHVILLSDSTNPTPDVEKYKYYYYCSNNVCPENKNKEQGVVSFTLSHRHRVCPLLLPHLQACQLNRDVNVDTPLGKVDEDTTWVVTDTSDDSFTFVITYKNGQPAAGDKKR